MAASGNPTISTFLELRDNMSPGLKAVTAQITKLKEAAKAAEDAILRMKTAQGMKPPAPSKTPRAPSLPSPTAPSTSDDSLTMRKLFGIATLSNLAAMAISKSADLAIDAMSSFFNKTVQIGKEYEDTQLKVASTLYSMGMAPSMEAAAAGATKYTDILRKASAVLPGEAKGYTEVFATAISDALASGVKDLKQYTDLVAQYTATTSVLGIDAAQAGRDLSMMLQGRAGMDVKTFVALRAYIGMTAKEWNKLNPEERYNKINKAIVQASQGMGLAADTANAKFGELQSRIDEIFALGNKPFFSGIKAAVTDINDWLERNKASILDFAKFVSLTLGDAFEGIAATLAKMTKGVMDLVGASSADMTIEQKYARREALRRESIYSPITLGEYRRLNREIAEYEKTQDRIKKTRAIFKPLDATFEKKMGADMATPEVKLLMRWREGFFDEFDKLGYKSAKEAFDVYGESLGLSKEEIFDVWQDLVKSKNVELSIAPTTTRELKVEFNNNRFDIRQEFAEGFDPDRIAVAFASDLARAGEMKVAAVTGPTFPQ